jgi:hypothetical protein
MGQDRHRCPALGLVRGSRGPDIIDHSIMDHRIMDNMILDVSAGGRAVGGRIVRALRSCLHG